MNDLFTLGYIQIISLSNQFKGLIKAKLALVGAYEFFRFNLFSPKKLLGPGAGRSTGTMINPIQTWHTRLLLRQSVVLESSSVRLTEARPQ